MLCQLHVTQTTNGAHIVTCDHQLQSVCAFATGVTNETNLDIVFVAIGPHWSRCIDHVGQLKLNRGICVRS